MAAGISRASAYAWAELNLVNAAGAIRGLDGARLAAAGTVIHDLNGEPLFLRTRVEGGGGDAYADTAIEPSLGSPLVAISHAEWSPQALREEAAETLRSRRRPISYDEARFVAYSFPKVAIQFLRDGGEVALLELYTWRQVPPARKRRKNEPPGDFERWSFLDEEPANVLTRNRRRYSKRVKELNRVIPGRELLNLRLIEAERFKSYLNRIDLWLNDTRELHYSTNDADHHACYELRGQQTSVWCVAASVQMLLDFYRYNYLQTRLATELGLGTLAKPDGLPYGDEQLVVDTLEELTSNALDAGLNWSPSWSEFRNEIRANRPLISFIPGHSRTVAGYTRSGLASLSPFRGLLVYDPWPPNVGVITRWENFDTQEYRVTFNAHLTLV